MALLCNKYVHNVVHVGVTVQGAVGGAGSRLGICGRMGKAESGSRRPLGRPPVMWVERTRFQNGLDMFQSGPSSDDFKCLWVCNVNV